MTRMQVFADSELNAYRVVYSVTCKTEIVDGYAECLLGLLMLSGIVVQFDMTKDVDAGAGMTTIHVKTLCTSPPLGSMGLGDIPDERGNQGT